MESSNSLTIKERSGSPSTSKQQRKHRASVAIKTPTKTNKPKLQRPLTSKRKKRRLPSTGIITGIITAGIVAGTVAGATTADSPTETGAGAMAVVATEVAIAGLIHGNYGGERDAS